MSSETLSLKARMLRAAFLGLPIPGRYLTRAIRMAAIDLPQLPTPIQCRDRWNRFLVEIVNPCDIIERHILFQGYFEYRESALIRQLLGPGKVFLDVGANIGWHSLLAAEVVGKSGRVLAFEPVSVSYGRLCRNIELNNFTHVRAFQFGLSNRDEVISIYRCEEDNSGANSLYGSEQQAPIERVGVKVGDAVLSDVQVSRIDLCKIDVEGAELDVLEGLSGALSEGKIKAIVIEVNPVSLLRAGRRPEELISFLRSHGFVLQDIRTGRPLDKDSPFNSTRNIVGRLTA